MSRFITSFFLFLLINITAGAAFPYIKFHLKQCQSSALQKPEQETSENHTWTEWALADFDKRKDNPPPVVFLGSSLMLMPINLADAHFLGRTIDGALHHQSLLFNCLINHGKNYPSVNFNFALPGLMPSDAYLLTRLFLSGEKCPQLIVYGLGPRDFLDNLLLSPAATDPYHCLSRNLSGDAMLSFTGKDWQSKVNYLLLQHMTLYEKREQIVGMAGKVCTLTPAVLPTKMSMQKLHTLLPGYNPMSIGLDECHFSSTPAVDPYRFNKDLNEYRLRYRRVDWGIFTCQTRFFLDLLKLAACRKIKVLVVAMPITSVNRQLLPDYVYAAYNDNLRVLSKSYGAYFIDFNEGGCFSDRDFIDTVHLNTAGGTRLLEQLSDYITRFNLLDRQKNNHLRLADTGTKM